MHPYKATHFENRKSILHLIAFMVLHTDFPHNGYNKFGLKHWQSGNPAIGWEGIGPKCRPPGFNFTVLFVWHLNDSNLCTENFSVTVSAMDPTSEHDHCQRSSNVGFRHPSMPDNMLFRSFVYRIRLDSYGARRQTLLDEWDLVR